MRVFEVTMKFIVAGRQSEYIGIFKCSGNEDKVQFKLFLLYAYEKKGLEEAVVTLM